MTDVSGHNWKLALILVCVVVVLSGCSASLIKGEKSGIFARFQNKNTPVYHEFCDVLIPSQLKINKKSTCVFLTSKFSVGVLSLKGRIDAVTLINFFQKNMSDDNWHIINSFKSKRSIMLFKKNSRLCTICISETGRFTCVEIWVLPDEAVCLPEFLNGDQLR